jgi:hypothetical protein
MNAQVLILTFVLWFGSYTQYPDTPNKYLKTGKKKKEGRLRKKLREGIKKEVRDKKIVVIT